MKKIGVIGLGIMGKGIAQNFLKKGYPLFVWNRTVSVSKELEKIGAVICPSPKEVTRKAEIVFEITANDQSSKAVWTGKKGILAGADKNKILIASATLSINWIDSLLKKCQELNFPFLDIGLTGSRAGAESGTLTLLCGGRKSVLDSIRPDLKAISKEVIYFGQSGSGMKYKLILNFLQAVHIIGFGQAMKIAKANNMDLKKVSQALAEKPGGLVTEKASKAYFQEPDQVNFAIGLITKDLKYAKEFADKLNLGLLDQVYLQYQKACKKGLENKDWLTINNSV